jgi:hypothetical protein
VGALVGVSVDETTVSALVGASVGASVGALVGASVGAVGEAVGAVGAVVGAGVVGQLVPCCLNIRIGAIRWRRGGEGYPFSSPPLPFLLLLLAERSPAR